MITWPPAGHGCRLGVRVPAHSNLANRPMQYLGRIWRLRESLPRCARCRAPRSLAIKSLLTAVGLATLSRPAIKVVDHGLNDSARVVDVGRRHKHSPYPADPPSWEPARFRGWSGGHGAVRVAAARRSTSPAGSAEFYDQGR